MVTEVSEIPGYPDSRTIVLTPQYDMSIPEDQSYSKATPSGRIEMQVDNPKAIEALPISKQFYVDFTPVER